MFLVRSVCLSVCLSVRRITRKLVNGFWLNFWRGRAWLKDQVLQFWWRSGSRFGSGSPKSEIRILRIGGGLCSLSLSSLLIHWIRKEGRKGQGHRSMLHWLTMTTVSTNKSQQPQTDPINIQHHAHHVVHKDGCSVWSIDNSCQLNSADNTCNGRYAVAKFFQEQFGLGVWEKVPEWVPLFFWKYLNSLVWCRSNSVHTIPEEEAQNQVARMYSRTHTHTHTTVLLLF